MFRLTAELKRVRGCICAKLITGEAMRVLEQLPAAVNNEVPDCRCGRKMQSVGSKIAPGDLDDSVCIYRCAHCGHQMHLTVWSAETLS